MTPPAMRSRTSAATTFSASDPATGDALRRPLLIRSRRAAKLAALALGWALSLAALAPSPVHAQHACDAPGEDGWTVAATVETAEVKDGAPYRAGDDLVLDRTTTLLPLCNYFNANGSYSLRSYSLDATSRTERVVLCRGGAAVAPYAGPCPPATSSR
jgi:hypothetical protein